MHAFQLLRKYSSKHKRAALCRCNELVSDVTSETHISTGTIRAIDDISDTVSFTATCLLQLKLRLVCIHLVHSAV